MRTLSTAYLNAAKAAGRYPNLYAIIHGTEDNITISGKDAIISANIVKGDTAKPAYFEVGRAISGNATIVVDRRRIADETYIVSGAKIEIFAEFDNPNGTAIASAILATMYISGYDNQDREIGYIYMVDHFVYAGGDFNPDNLTYPISCSDLLTAAFSQAGMSNITMTIPCDPNVKSAPYKANEPVADGMSGDPYTCRDIIAKIAGMQMSDIFIDAAGVPKIYGYGNYITTAVTDDLILEQRVSAEVYQIYQVLVYKTDERMIKDEAHFQRLPYSPRFENMDDVGRGSDWWGEIVARADVFVRKDWTTAAVTIAGVGELELGDFVLCGTAEIPIFVSGIVYHFENAHFTETLYSYAYTLEEYYQAPTKSTVVTTDHTSGGSGTGGVGEFTDELHLNERFNDYSGNIISSGNWQHNEGHSNVISGGDANHVEGYNNKAVNTCNYVHIQGSDNVADGCSNVDIGGAYNTMTNGFCFTTIVRGERNVIQGASRSAVFGAGNMAISCDKYLICGERNTAQYGNSSILGGYNNTLTSSDYSLVCGSDNQGTAYASAVFGVGNSFSNVNYALIFGVYGTADSSKRLVIGGGQSSARANIFEVTTSGAVYAAGGYNAIGADYAEYFEWSDGNPDSEDRRGLLVSLDGDKISLANGDDILGIVSAAPSVTGNSAALGWHGRYKTDVFGVPIRDEEGKPILSDDYDRDVQYIPRSQRPEWAAIGLVGRLIVCDNGHCQVGKPIIAKNGLAIPALQVVGENLPKIKNVRVLRRVDDTHIEVLIR